MNRVHRFLTREASRYDRKFEPGRKHGKLVCLHGTRPALTVASSPTNFDHWKRQVLRDLETYNNGKQQ